MTKKQQVEKPIDSEVARQTAGRALGFHQGAVEAAGMSVVRALACGAQLVKAKQLLPHGDYIGWYKKYLRAISPDTANRYVKLALILAERLAGTGVMAKLDVAPEELTPAYIRRFVPQIGEVIEGKMLTELYQDYGIIKPRKAHDQEAQDRMKRVQARNPRDRKEEQLYFLQDWFAEVDERLVKFTEWANDIRVEAPELIETATEKLKTSLENLTGKKVVLS